MNQLALATFALLIESFIGYPAFLQNAFGHPVQWMGRLISFLDDGLNDEEAEPHQNRSSGVLAMVVLIAICALPAFAVQYALMKLPYGYVLNVLLAVPFIAQHSLGQHVEAVAKALPHSIQDARSEVSKIVGRDVTALNQADIAKAALESLAENASDGVVAPIFWYALLGLPGIVAYKAINTADSMIGHKSDKYLHFGWAAAKLDDLLNLPASRLTGLLFVVAAYAQGKAAVQNAWATMRRDAPKHNSPNAGWPEAAMAGALGLQFGGARDYDGETLMLPTMGSGRSPAGVKDIEDGLSLFRNAM
ncbi:MAG: adenosylcobinamide-phosphate synthase CbiB, partial [Pseudomonadota bacterium]|nr:adenosylcobinamide-phosphate synthase CbiB [Pseudomonadota bacterium]